MAKKMSSKFVALASVAVGAVYAAGYLVTDSAPTALATSTGATSGVAAAGIGSKTSSGLNASNQSTPPNGAANDSGQGYGRHHHHHDGESGGYGQSGWSLQSDSGTSSTASSGSASSGTASSSAAGAATPPSSSASGSSSSAGTSSSSSASNSTSSKSQKYLDGTYSASGSNRIGTIQVSVTVKSDKITDVQITGCDTHYPEAYINPVLPQQVLSQQNTNISYVSGATLSSMDFQDAVNQALQQAQNPNYNGA